MGTYSIVIEGSGINHNGTPQDADEMGKAFVSALRASGHTNVKGYFAYGPQLATQLEATMERGVGHKLLEPLAPLCDWKTYRPSENGRMGWDELCQNEATHALRDGLVYVNVRCDEKAHRLEEPAGDIVSIREAVL